MKFLMLLGLLLTLVTACSSPEEKLEVEQAEAKAEYKEEVKEAQEDYQEEQKDEAQDIVDESKKVEINEEESEIKVD